MRACATLTFATLTQTRKVPATQAEGGGIGLGENEKGVEGRIVVDLMWMCILLAKAVFYC